MKEKIFWRVHEVRGMGRSMEFCTVNAAWAVTGSALMSLLPMESLVQS